MKRLGQLLVMLHGFHGTIFLFSNVSNVTWISWDHFSIFKCLGGVAILFLKMHLMARRFAVLRDMCEQDQPWISMI